MTQKLYRSRTHRVLGGIAGGLAEYFKVDPVLVRVLFVIALFFSGFGFLLYIILWIIIPEEPVVFNFYGNNTGNTGNENSGDPQTSDNSINNEYSNDPFMQEKIKPQKKSTGFIGGIILIALGFLFLFENLFEFLDAIDIFPFLFIIIGVILLFNYTKKS